MSAEPVIDYLQRRHDAVMARLDAFLRLPSVSTDPAYAQGMADTRAFLLDWLTGLGLSDVQLLDGGGQPAVYGAWLGAPGAPTITTCSRRTRWRSGNRHPSSRRSVTGAFMRAVPRM
jgi:acetylornithine deacetylase/succinyl-diaminopimelate desuccinylase-like protein